MKALALKYRPQNYDELVGQETVSKSLKFALDNDKIAHAYLFSGLRGSGKTSSARIFAKCLNCEQGVSSHPCGQCDSCKGTSFDIVEMDAASNRKLEDIQALIEQTKYAPSTRYKIFIIDEVHMLTKEAFNALLKTLEEPPNYVKFILATTDPLKIPPTILSRTQHFRFFKIPESKIIAHLEYILGCEQIPYDKEALKMIARSGGGSLRDTLTLLDQGIIYSGGEVSASSISSMLGLLDTSKIDEFFGIVLRGDKDGLLGFLDEIKTYEISRVIDDMCAYLKDRFFEQDGRFSFVLLEKFMQILARGKNMLALCDDEEFVLCVMSFMLMDAALLCASDTAGSAVGAGVADVNVASANAAIGAGSVAGGVVGDGGVVGANATNAQQAKFSQTSASNAKSADVAGAGVVSADIAGANAAAPTNEISLDSKPNQTSANNAANQIDTFMEFKKLVFARDYELGACLQKHFEMVGLDGGVLTLDANPASDEDKALIRSKYKLLKQMTKELFDAELKIIATKLDSMAAASQQNTTPQPSASTNSADNGALKQASTDSGMIKQPDTTASVDNSAPKQADIAASVDSAPIDGDVSGLDDESRKAKAKDILASVTLAHTKAPSITQGTEQTQITTQTPSTQQTTAQAPKPAEPQSAQAPSTQQISDDDKYFVVLNALDDISLQVAEVFAEFMEFDRVDNGVLYLLTSADDAQSQSIIKQYYDEFKSICKKTYNVDKIIVKKKLN